MNEPKKEDYSLYDLWMYHADYKLWAEKQIAELKEFKDDVTTNSLWFKEKIEQAKQIAELEAKIKTIVDQRDSWKRMKVEESDEKIKALEQIAALKKLLQLAANALAKYSSEESINTWYKINQALK